MINAKKTTWFAAALLMAVVAGCEENKGENGTSSFFPEYDAPRTTKKLYEAQQAAGDRADSNLDTAHFDREELNSLGLAKLDSMLKDDDSSNPLVVYMNMPQDASMSGRQKAVGRYLKDHGLKDSQVKFVVGPNPDSKGRSDEALAGWAKTDTGSSSSEGGATGGGSSSGSAMK